MTREEKALIYFKDLRGRKVKDYSSVLDTAPKGTVVYEAASAEIEIYDTAIKALEQTTWIPVSERLPEENGFYLATCDGEICGEDQPFTGLAEFENGKWVDDEDDYQCVLAWMPLPEPYKAESEEIKDE